VLGVTATGGDLAGTGRRAYAAIDRLDWPDGFCRRDIGERAIQIRSSPADPENG
jgi:phosphoribosylamine--glycine ligase